MEQENKQNTENEIKKDNKEVDNDTNEYCSCDSEDCNCSRSNDSNKCTNDDEEKTKLLEDRIVELEAKLNIANENVLRVMAETDNIRKRMEKDKVDHIRRANKDLVVNLINFMDDFDRAIEVGENNISINSTEFYKGITLIRKRFIDFLSSNGVEEIEALGSDFDPNTHEALQVIESDDVETEKVSQVYMKGYTLNGDIVRSPKVVVSKPKS